MVWLAGAIVLVALMAFVPATRVVIARLLGLGLLLLLLGGLYYWLDSMRTNAREEREQREKERRQREAASLVPPTALQFDELTLWHSDNPVNRSEVKGRVRNRGAHTLSQFDLEVTVEDCREDVDVVDVYKVAHCDTIAQDTAVVLVMVPPGQVRDFAATISVATRLQGRVRWFYRVTGTLATQ